MVRLNGDANVIILIYRDPAGIRTQDPHIKSVMLYRLSYGIGFSRELDFKFQGKHFISELLTPY